MSFTPREAMRALHSEKEVKKMNALTVKKAYLDLANSYKDILKGNVIMCPKCGTLYKPKDFYGSPDYVNGKFPVCKECIVKMAEQRLNDDDEPNETKKSVQNVLHFMNLPYFDESYELAMRNSKSSKVPTTPFKSYLRMVVARYRGYAWEDSVFSEDKNENGVGIEYTPSNIDLVKNGKKRFGSGYKEEDYIFLENEYQDWITRYECNTKAQESIFERLSFKKWEINNASRKGQSTKDLDKTYQELLATGNLQPRQNSNDTLSDAQTLGTLIAKWETERPLPDIDPELEDVDKIGKYIDVFFRGHMAKLLGLKNTLSHLYQRFMDKYTVKRPEYDGDEDSEALFDAIFGDHSKESEYDE